MSPHAVMKNASILIASHISHPFLNENVCTHVIHLRLGMYPSLNTVGAGRGYED